MGIPSLILVQRAIFQEQLYLDLDSQILHKQNTQLKFYQNVTNWNMDFWFHTEIQRLLQSYDEA